MVGKSGDLLMGFKGFEHPKNKDEVIPCLKNYLQGIIESLQKLDSEQLDKKEVIGAFETVLSMTEPEVGYFFCPYIPDLI